jgi:hypothetical protein
VDVEGLLTHLHEKWLALDNKRTDSPLTSFRQNSCGAGVMFARDVIREYFALATLSQPQGDHCPTCGRYRMPGECHGAPPDTRAGGRCPVGLPNEEGVMEPCGALLVTVCDAGHGWPTEGDTRAGGDTERERIRRFSDFVELSAGAGIVCHVGPLGAQLQMEWHGEQPLSDFMDQVLDAARRGEEG